MTKQVIEDLKLGWELSSFLKLPPDYQFTVHHLGCLFADDKFIRPFSRVRYNEGVWSKLMHSLTCVLFVMCRDVVVGLEEFIRSDRELLVHLLIHLRAHYTGFLQSANSATVGRASVEGTILGTLDEV